MASHFVRPLQRKLQEAGLQGCVDADGFKRLLQYAEDVQGSLDRVHEILQLLKSNMAAGDVDADIGDADGPGADSDGDAATIGAADVEAAVRQLAGVVEKRDLAFVVSAFDVPRIVYDPVTKRLHADNRPPRMLATAEDKHRLYLNRFNLLLQRLRRNRRFQPPNPLQAAAGAAPQAQLTELMGLKGSAGETCIVMGVVGSMEDGHLALEDAGAKVPLDLSEARLASGFLTENCVVVAEGAMRRDGVFHAAAVGFPPCEPRSALPATAARLDFFGAPPLSGEEAAAAAAAEAEGGEERIVFLQDVWLDRPETFEALEMIFSGYEEADAVPAMFVLIGNFTSRRGDGGGGGSGGGAGGGGGGGGGGGAGGADGGADYPALKDGFAALASLVERHAKVRDASRFVFVPGPGDPGLGGALPQPPLPDYFAAEVKRALPRCVFATNPCRIRYFTKEIVVFRHDALTAARRRCLAPCEGLAGGGAGAGAGESDDPAVAFAHLALTLLQQSHLCPLPLAARPVHWAYDHALQLYPLPHALVLADASAGQEEFQHEGCVVFNPGSLHERLFGAYAPFQDAFEASALPGAAALEADGARADSYGAGAGAGDAEMEEAEAAAAAAEVDEEIEVLDVDEDDDDDGGGGAAVAAGLGSDQRRRGPAGADEDDDGALPGPCAARGSGSEDEIEDAGSDGEGGGANRPRGADGRDDGDDVLPSWLLEAAAVGGVNDDDGGEGSP